MQLFFSSAARLVFVYLDMKHKGYKWLALLPLLFCILDATSCGDDEDGNTDVDNIFNDTTQIAYYNFYGTVSDENGDGLADISITVKPILGTFNTEAFYKTVKTDAQGKYIYKDTFSAPHPSRFTMVCFDEKSIYAKDSATFDVFLNVDLSTKERHTYNAKCEQNFVLKKEK